MRMSCCNGRHASYGMQRLLRLRGATRLAPDQANETGVVTGCRTGFCSCTVSVVLPRCYYWARVAKASPRHARVVEFTPVTTWKLHAVKLWSLPSAPVTQRGCARQNGAVVPCLACGVGRSYPVSVLWTEGRLVVTCSRGAKQACIASYSRCETLFDWV